MNCLIDAIAIGIMTSEDVGSKIINAREERDRFVEQLKETPVENVVALHPSALARYEEQLKSLGRP